MRWLPALLVLARLCPGPSFFPGTVQPPRVLPEPDGWAWNPGFQGPGCGQRRQRDPEKRCTPFISGTEVASPEPVDTQVSVGASQEEPASGLDVGECEKRAREMLGVGRVEMWQHQSPRGQWRNGTPAWSTSGALCMSRMCRDGSPAWLRGQQTGVGGEGGGFVCHEHPTPPPPPLLVACTASAPKASRCFW